MLYRNLLLMLNCVIAVWDELINVCNIAHTSFVGFSRLLFVGMSLVRYRTLPGNPLDSKLQIAILQCLLCQVLDPHQTMLLYSYKRYRYVCISFTTIVLQLPSPIDSLRLSQSESFMRRVISRGLLFYCMLCLDRSNVQFCYSTQIYI